VRQKESRPKAEKDEERPKTLSGGKEEICNFLERERLKSITLLEERRARGAVAVAALQGLKY